MVVVFSVNGALAAYSIEFMTSEHVIAKRTGNGEGRTDIPEEIEFFCKKGAWTAESLEQDVINPIIIALSQAEKPG